MAKFAYIDEHGSVSYTAWVSDAADAVDTPSRIALADKANDAEILNSVYFQGTWLLRPSGMGRHYLPGPGGSWYDSRPIQVVRDAAWEAIKAEREQRMQGTFDHAGNTYDIDPVNLSGASIDAREALIAGESWTQMWVLANNSVVTLTALEMIALARAAKNAVSTLWGTSQYLRGLIEAATTIPEVEAITWP